MADKRLSIDTLVIHGGTGERYGGAALTPIFRSTVFGVGGDTPYYDIRYPRLSTTPNHLDLGVKLARLEGGEAATVTGSGMAAISTALMAVVGSGGHLLCQDQLYGGSHALLTQDFPRFGIDVEFVDVTTDGWASHIVPGKTKAIYVEAMTNPLLRVADHHAIVREARNHGIVSIIDATFTPPVNFRPIELGYDIVVHSATKYLNGHSDLVAGAIITSADHMKPIAKLLAHLGGMLDAGGCYLLERGLKTLPLRVRQQNATAMEVATFLEGHPAVERVHYAGLPSHPHHSRARELFSGFGGVLSFELAGGAAAADRLIEGLSLAFSGPSLGGVETLVTRPVVTSHRAVPPADRARLGISDGLIRLSIGLESPADLIADLQAHL